MTHDELLADIKKSCPDEDICKNCCALLAVVELHKSQEITLPDGSHGQNCEHCDNLWGFCPTVIAIFEQLK